MAVPRARSLRPTYATPGGRLFVGDAADVLASKPASSARGQVQLVFTSPPFPLCREKRYGNLRGEEYTRWLAGFAKPLADYLTPTGSIVIELGNGWEAGRPTVSTASLKALLAFQEAAGLHLCQEFIGYNPARLPTPAEWVTVRRIRVKDAYTRLWWLSPTPHPKADNRRVLTAYSDSMKKLLQKGTYNGGARPSGHHVGHKSFLKQNGGAIPPNVLIPPADDLPATVIPISNTGSRSQYLDACRAMNVVGHPARMSEALVDFFVRFLTDPGDLVLDPFAGSNTTGAVAESLGRRWIGIERDEEYARASRARFAPAA